MKKLLLASLLVASTLAQAEDKKVHKVLTDASEIVIVLNNLFQSAKDGKVVQAGQNTDPSALSLAGYKVVKITFLSQDGICSAALTFNKPDISQNGPVMEFALLKKDPNYGTIFNAYCM